MPGAWRFAWATNFSSSLDVAFTHVITLVVGALVGPAAGRRCGGSARQVADAHGQARAAADPGPLSGARPPAVSQAEQAMRRLALQVGVVGGAVGTALLLVTAICAGRPLLTLVMGQAFAPAASVMIWQVAAAVIGVWALPLEPMLVSLGRPGDALKVRLVVAGALLAALPFVIGRFGIRGRRRGAGGGHGGARGGHAVHAAAAIAAGHRRRACRKLACAEPPSGEGRQVMITPTAPDRAIRLADFATLTEALDFAASGETGLNLLLACAAKLAEALPYARAARRGPGAGRSACWPPGLTPGDRVGLIAETDGDFVRAFFACQYAGLVPAPLPLPAPLGGREAYVEQIAPHAGVGRAPRPCWARPRSPPGWPRPPTARTCASPARWPTCRRPPARPCRRSTPDDPCYLQFSSGSTRFPTGVLVHPPRADGQRPGDHPRRAAGARRATGRSPGCRSITTWAWSASC